MPLNMGMLETSPLQSVKLRQDKVSLNRVHQALSMTDHSSLHLSYSNCLWPGKVPLK